MLLPFCFSVRMVLLLLWIWGLFLLLSFLSSESVTQHAFNSVNSSFACVGISSVFRWASLTVWKFGTAVSLPYWGKADSPKVEALSVVPSHKGNLFCRDCSSDSGKHRMSSLASTWINVFKHFLKCSVFPFPSPQKKKKNKRQRCGTQHCKFK